MNQMGLEAVIHRAFSTEVLSLGENGK